MAPYPSSLFPIRSVPDHYTDTLIKPCLVNNFCLVLTSHFTDKNQTFFFFRKNYWRKGKQKKGRKPISNIPFSLMHPTAVVTAECNGSEEFGDDVDVVQTSDTG